MTSTQPEPGALHTYHCPCSTLLLCSAYALSTLPRRAAPSADKALILPLPPLPSPRRPSDAPVEDHLQQEQHYLPSMLSPNFKSGKKVTLVRREDGYERRRVWRCGRCGLGVGYELEGTRRGQEGHADGDGKREEMRVLYLMEGLVETGELGRGGEGAG